MSKDIILAKELTNQIKDLLSFKNEKEELEHMAHMVSFRILSEVIGACEKQNISDDKLAKLCGVSKSYISQLFHGNRMVNMAIIAKFEKALNITFVIKSKKYKPNKLF